MKKIVTCCDGTWNKPGTRDRGKPVKTNVQKMYEATASNGVLPQVKYYGQGVGTGFTLQDNFLGGSTGLGIDKNIMNAYKFLMWNYDPGDQIYLFGFSRGAYTVRSLAGLIRNCGVMKPSFLHLIQEAYELYRDRSSLTHPDSDLMKAFKKAYGIDEQETYIYFLGVWDTVGALGIPLKWFDILNRKYQFHDVKISSQIRYAYHALAIDERRKIFHPTLWEVSENATSGKNTQTSEQVWFSGVHSNIGGGYCDCGLSDITFAWMAEKAAATGLALNDEYLKSVNPQSLGELRDSASGVYRLLKKQIRTINSGIAMRLDEESGHQRPEKVQRNESIHYSCFERSHKNKQYHPANVQKALSINTPFDPLKDQWKKEWLDYLP